MDNSTNPIEPYIIENDETGYIRIVKLTENQAKAINWYLESFCGSNNEDISFEKLRDYEGEDI